MVLFTILLSSPPVQSQRHLFSVPSPNNAIIILIRDNSDDKEPLALYMSHISAKSDIGGSAGKSQITVKLLRAAGERGMPCRNEKLNVVLFENAGLPEMTMPDVFQESLVMVPAKAAKLERLIAESRDICDTKTVKIKQDVGYGEVIVKVGNVETSFSCVKDLLKQNKKEKFIIINSLTSGRISLN